MHRRACAWFQGRQFPDLRFCFRRVRHVVRQRAALKGAGCLTKAAHNFRMRHRRLIANVTQQVYQMARAAGLNKEDGSAVVKVLERLAGVTVGGGAT